MIDNRNLFLAVALSLAILLVSQFYFDMTRPPPPEDAKKTEQSAKAPGKLGQRARLAKTLKSFAKKG
ncbi:MAG: hypothetical protein VW338_17050 [Rhodospirillaceae bacterium]